MPLLDLRADHHARTLFCGGADTLVEVVRSAERAGLTTVGITDWLPADADWLPAYASAIDRARGRTHLRLLAGAAAEILDRDGTLDLPHQLVGVDHIAVVSRRLPLDSGPAATAEVQRLLHSGALAPRDAVEILVTGYLNALDAAAQRAQAVLARPFSILPEIGLTEDEVDDAALAAVVDACRATGAAVEVNEAWQCPSPRVACALAEAGVRLVAASDAYDARDVGKWSHVLTVAVELSGVTRPTTA
jgi:putative hydrolase